MITFTELELVLMGAVAVLVWVQHTTRKESDMHELDALHMMEAIEGIAEERYAVAKDRNGDLRLINLQEKA
jgi:predicted HNH restriction endonuclease